MSGSAKCPHPDFKAIVGVARIEDIGRFVADIQIRCSVCNVEMRFLGLPAGINYDGAAVGVDGTFAHLGIHPVGEDVPPVRGAIGFSVRTSP